MTSAWSVFDEIRTTGPAVVAQRLGLDLILGRTLACPACNAERRSSRGLDNRGPVGLTHDGLGWRCHRCGAGGDAVTFAAFAVAGTDRPTEWRPVLEALERLGLAPPHPQPAPTTHEKRPPIQELIELFGRCQPIHVDDEVSAWARSRGIDSITAADRELAVALRPNVPVPRWAWLRGPWPAAGYRIVLPLWNARGRLTSCHARNVRADADPKGASPANHAVHGLVLADYAGRLMLEHGTLAGPLWVVEGVPDFLVTATAWGDAADPGPAVLGIVSGSWTAEIAARVPHGARVIVAVHHDEAGTRYVARILETLGNRVHVERWSPAERRVAS